jgi:hypothetical protein
MTREHIETLRNLLENSTFACNLTPEEEEAIQTAIEENDPQEQAKMQRFRARLADQDQRSLFSNRAEPKPWSRSGFVVQSDRNWSIQAVMVEACRSLWDNTKPPERSNIRNVEKFWTTPQEEDLVRVLLKAVTVFPVEKLDLVRAGLTPAADPETRPEKAKWLPLRTIM